MLGFWINYGTNQHISTNSIAQWVIPLALQLAPGLLLGLGMFFICPESPRWLARQDNFEAAEKVLCDIRKLSGDHPYVMHEMGEIRQQVEERSTMKMSKKEQFKKLFQKGTRNRMAIGLALMFLQSFTGVNIIVSRPISPSTFPRRLPHLFHRPTTPLASSRLWVSRVQTPSSSRRASTASRRPSECAPSPSTSLRKSVAVRASSGAPHSVAFLCGTLVAT